MSETRCGLTPITDARLDRLRAGLTIAEVAAESGLTSFRISIIERDPTKARAGEIDRHRAAIKTLQSRRERKGGPALREEWHRRQR